MVDSIILEQYQPQGYVMGHVVGFAHLLRSMGIDVGPRQVIDCVTALTHISIIQREDMYAAMRCTLIQRSEDLVLFDAAFTFYWKAPSADFIHELMPQLKVAGRPLRLPRRKQDDTPPSDDSQEHVEPDMLFSYSAYERLRTKDFGTFTWEEVQACQDLLHRMDWRIAERRTRRKQAAPRGRLLDWRRTIRANIRYGGEPIELRWKKERTRQRPLVVLCDISGSMERYSRILLQFVHTISNGLRNVETFVFGTRLTRLTHLLQRRDIDDAINDVSKQVVDWSGGTRIGDAIKTFNYEWVRRVLGRGAIVLLISDGWDRGDSDILDREMGRLQRSCYRLIWLNPLLGSPGYEPLTKGMQTALPYVDDFLPVHNLVSLEQLGGVLSMLQQQRMMRRQQLVV